MEEQEIPTIDVVPVMTISINEAGVWFAESVIIDENNQATSVVRTSMNLNHLFGLVRTSLQKNRDYFEAVAKRAADVKRIEAAKAKETEVKTEE